MKQNYNNIKFKVACVAVFLGLIGFSSADAQNTNGNTQTQKNVPFDYGQLIDENIDTPKKSYEDTLYKVNLETFEEGGNWSISMPTDFGTATVLTKNGAPAALKADGNTNTTQVNPNQNPENTGVAQNQNPTPEDYFVNGVDEKSKILGVKVDFYPGRKMSWARIDAITPIRLNGVTKGLEVWVVGRNLKHRLYFIVQDVNKKERLIDAGYLNFLGWRKITAQVPSTIMQENSRDARKNGLVFKGFLISFNLIDSYGQYYAYFDNLSAEVSRFKEENTLGDNPSDNW